MLSAFYGFRNITFASVFLRLFFAALCGGVIGMEREFKRRPAGFRTHILICLGAAMTTATGQWLGLVMHYYTDVARLGAQVIAGIGFIGAGTIIVTKHQRVKGLTTAAGLWSAAIVGLCIGVGFYEGGLCATALIMFAEIMLSKLEYGLLSKMPEVNIYMEYTGKVCMDAVLELLREQSAKVLSLEITRHTGSESHNASAIFHLRLKDMSAACLMGELTAISGVVRIEEL